MGEIIAFSGTHGTGKTTSALKLAESLKLSCPEKSITILMEPATMSPFPINQKTTSESQMWIFTAQIKAELEYLSRFDIVVSDRSIVDSIAYTLVAGFDTLAYAMVEMARHHLQHYNKIIIKTIANNPFCFHDGIRAAQDDEFRERVEQTLIELYDLLNCQVDYDN